MNLDFCFITHETLFPWGGCSLDPVKSERFHEKGRKSHRYMNTSIIAHDFRLVNHLVKVFG